MPAATKFYVYCLTEVDSPNGPCKVGVATNMSKRLSSLQAGNWRALCVMWTVEFADRDHALTAESHILSRLRPSMYGRPGPRRRLKSEWVDASPTEASAAGKLVFDALLLADAA